MENFVTFFIQITGIILILFACNIGRKEDSKIKPFSFEYFFQILLVLIGLILYRL